MSIQEVSAEHFAELFHHYHHVLNPDFGCGDARALETWDDMPEPEKIRMIAAVRLALVELDSTPKEENDSRRYFAKPGEAEWGC